MRHQHGAAGSSSRCTPTPQHAGRVVPAPPAAAGAAGNRRSASQHRVQASSNEKPPQQPSQPSPSPGKPEQQQVPARDSYVAEPWEIAEPWDDDSSSSSSWRQDLDEEPHPSYLQQQDWGTGSTAPASATEADLLASVEWLLEGEDEDEGDEQREDEDGWLLDEPDSSQASLQQQQQQDAPQRPAPWQQQTPPQQQQQQHEQHRQQQQRPQAAAAPSDLQASWEAALAVSLDVLALYDVRYDVDRPARLSSAAAMRRPPGRGWQQQQQGEAGLGPDDVSLTAAAVAAARASRRRRGRRQQAPPAPLLQAEQQQQEQQQAVPEAAALSAAADAGSQQQQQQKPPQQQEAWERDEQQPLPEDPRWLAVSRVHAAYLSYMQQLAAMAVSKQQQQHQLVYQVGISDSWVQLSHLLKVFGGRELTPPVVATLWKRLAAIINRKVFVRMSHAERCHYDAFIERLVAQSIVTLQHHSNTSSSSTGSGSSIPPVIQPNSSARTGSSSSSSSSSSSGWPSRRRSEGSSGVTSPVLPAHLAAVAYGMAVLGARSEPLAAAVVEASAGLLRQAAQEAAAAAPAVLAATSTSIAQGAEGSGAAGASRSSSSSQASGPVAAGSGVGGWGGAEVSSLMWGLGTVGYCPPAEWLQDMHAVSKELMPRCQPAQLWGVLWGFAQSGCPPEEPWLASWLAAAQQQLDGFDAEGLAHSIWALAALGHVPHKLWLRAYCGMVAYKIKSFVAGQLAMVLPALSTLGYKPRPELRRTMVAQVRRNLHTYTPSQLVSVLSALASYAPGEGEPSSSSGWHPGRLFLYDFITHSSPPDVMTAWSGRQAAQVLWAFSRFRYVPDRSYLVALTAHLQTQLPLCGADALSMAVWALAALRQPLPSTDWGAQWCDAAIGAAEDFGPQALAHGLSGMAALRMQPPAALMQALTRRASACLSSLSCMELGLLVAALADLHWRPSDAWMTAFVSQVSQQLPAFENEDYGLLLYGLASLAQPLQPALLARFCREVRRKLYGLSGEGLGLLVWGLAQYGYDEMPDAQQWWAALFTECSSKWASAGLRGSALMALGLAQLGPRHGPPGEWESDWVDRYKALLLTRPGSWEELVVGFRAAAGLEPAEVLPVCPWLCSLLLQLGKSWGLQVPGEKQGAPVVSVAAVIDRVDVRVAATAALRSGAGSGSGSSGALSVGQEGSGGELGGGDVEPTSATAVLL